MANRPAQFTQADIKRAVCAMIAAGVKVSGVRVDATGFTVLTEIAPGQTAAKEGEARNAADIAAARLGLADDGSH